jgi:hypothetical protein
MRGALLIGALTACSSVTEVVVVVSAGDVRVPNDVDKVRVVVENTMAASPDLPLCSGGAFDNCLRLPIVATLVPGPDHPTDQVTVQVTASRQGQDVIRDAATFMFHDGQRGRLDFVLSTACLGKLDCAGASPPLACGSDGQCVAVPVTPLGVNPTFDAGIPDLATKMNDLATADLSSPPDLSQPDLLQPDLAPGSFASAPCVAAMSIAASGGFLAGTCAAYCNSQGKTCHDDACVTNRGIANFGVEAWTTDTDCSSYASSAGQASCTDDLTTFSAPTLAKYRCCCL